MKYEKHLLFSQGTLIPIYIWNWNTPKLFWQNDRSRELKFVLDDRKVILDFKVSVGGCGWVVTSFALLSHLWKWLQTFNGSDNLWHVSRSKSSLKKLLANNLLHASGFEIESCPSTFNCARQWGAWKFLNGEDNDSINLCLGVTWPQGNFYFPPPLAPVISSVLAMVYRFHYLVWKICNILFQRFFII